MIKTAKLFILRVIIILLIVGCSSQLYNKENQTDKTASLSEAYKNNFVIGAAMSAQQIIEKDKQSVSIIKKEFNTISPENVMKWMFIHPKPNTFVFDTTDMYVSFGEKNNMHIVGHTLVWHSQLADFMKEVKDPSKMANYMENHINTIVTRYKGRIDTWDVVNEALKEDGSLRESVFLEVMGERYLENAFKLAEQADPKADLAYNDYNLCKPKKRDGAVRLVKQLQNSGAKINSIGIQAHWKLNTPTLNEIEKSIIAFSDLGVKVMFTELDISVLPNPWELVGAGVNQNFEQFEGDPKMNPYPKNLPDSMQNKLAKRYEDIFKLFLKHEDKISRITFWGVTDKHSWLNDWPIKGRTNYPLLFDRNHQPKKAYYSVFNLKNLTTK